MKVTLTFYKGSQGWNSKYGNTNVFADGMLGYHLQSYSTRDIDGSPVASCQVKLEECRGFYIARLPWAK